MGAEPGVEGRRKGTLILSSLAGRVMSLPAPHRGEGEWVAHGGRGGAGRNGGGASPPPTQGPGTHLFHLLGREGHRVRGGPRWNPTHLPPPTKRSPKQQHKDRQGAEPAPQLGGGQGPPGMEHRGGGAEGRGTRRQEQGTGGGGKEEKEDEEMKGWGEKGQEELRAEGEGEGGRGRGG